MSNINSLLNQTPGTANTQQARSKSESSTSKLTGTTEQFLQILLAQLQHQDPLEPMKGTEFIDSISRLSNVEQAINTNAHLEKMTNILQSNNSPVGSPVSYIDKNIEFDSSQIALKNSQSDILYELDANNPQKGLRMIIKNSFGDVVFDDRAESEPGVNTFAWDGKDFSGNQLDDGLYTVAIIYQDPASKDPSKPDFINIPTFTTGKVTEAHFTGEEPILSISGVEIPLNAVRKLYGNDEI